MSFVLAAVAGLVCGVISGFGIGGGSLLMVYLTAIAAIEQKSAQGINLLYFLPTAAAALFLHAKNRFIRWQLVLPAAAAGSLIAALAAYLSAGLDSGLLRKIFGGFLLLIGLTELFKKKDKSSEKSR